MSSAQSVQSNAADYLPLKSVTASGSGEVKVPATIAKITIGVQRENLKAKEALQSVSAQMNAIISDLKAKGLIGDKLQTLDISLNKRYEYSGSTRIDKGFIAQQSLIVTDDISNIGKDIDSVVSLGACEVNSIQFSASESEIAAAKDESIKRAVLDAKKKAEISISALNLVPKEIVRVTVLDSQENMPIFRGRALAMDAVSQETSVEGGSLSVSSRVEIAIGY